jgi:hypothetical protein
MASPIEAVVLLCDAAYADPGGKVHMLGAGWSVTSSPTAASAVVAMVKIPWDRANLQIPFSLTLRDADGQVVELLGSRVGIENQNMEAGRPPGLPAGTPLDVPLVFNFPSLQLAPGRYEWLLTVADQEFPAAFTVRLGPHVQ